MLVIAGGVSMSHDDYVLLFFLFVLIVVLIGFSESIPHEFGQ